MEYAVLFGYVGHGKDYLVPSGTVMSGRVWSGKDYEVTRYG